MSRVQEPTLSRAPLLLRQLGSCVPGLQSTFLHSDLETQKNLLGYDFDYIVAMNDIVADELRSRYPAINGRLRDSWNINDPYGRNDETYVRNAREIQKQVEELSAILRDRKK